MRTRVEVFGYLLLLFALASCAQLGLPTAETCNERVAVAISGVTQVRTSATSLLQAKKITVDDAKNVLAQTDHARAGVDIARGLCGTDPLAAQNKLTTASTILQALSAYLTSRGAQ